jgi:hypothetical protein
MNDRTQSKLGHATKRAHDESQESKLCTFIRVENNGCWYIFKSDDGSGIEVPTRTSDASSAGLEKADDQGRTQHHRLRCEVLPVEFPSMFTTAVLKDEVKTK